MAATMQSVTTRGFGNGTFDGSLPLVVSLGFGLGDAVVSPAYESQRHVLYGTSLQRHTLYSTSLVRHELKGQSQ